MQKKLVHSTALSVLFGISSIIFRMKNDPADPYTHLTLTTIYNEFIVFSPSDLINQDKNAFEEDWTNRDFQQYIKQHNRSSNNNVTRLPTIFDFKPSQLIITNKNDKFSTSTLSVITEGNKAPINLGDFEQSSVTMIKTYLTKHNKPTMQLFRTGWYYPINKIMQINPNGESFIIDVASAAVVSYKGKAEEDKKPSYEKLDEGGIIQEVEKLKSEIKRRTWTRNILFTGGVSILLFAYIFSDRFIQFFHSFKNASPSA